MGGRLGISCVGCLVWDLYVRVLNYMWHSPKDMVFWGICEPFLLYLHLLVKDPVFPVFVIFTLYPIMVSRVTILRHSSTWARL